MEKVANAEAKIRTFREGFIIYARIASNAAMANAAPHNSAS
jgi:hypothetical protein